MAPPAASPYVKGPKCLTHRAPVGWMCTGCGQRLCPDCAAEKVVYPATVVACVLCGALAEPIVRHRRDAASLTVRILRAPLFPFRGEGLIAWLALALLPAALSYLHLEPIAWFIMASALFGVVRSTGRGADTVELSDFVDVFSDFLMPNLRFALVTLPVWGGALWAWYEGSRPLWWAFMLFGALWVPSALLLASSNTSLRVLLNPLAVFTTTRRLGNDFFAYLGGLAAMALLMVPAVLLALLVYALPVPFLSRLGAWAVFLYPPFVAAHIAGLVLSLHGDVLDLGRQEDFNEPVLGAVAPRGALPATPQYGPQVDFTPIEVAHAGPPPGSHPGAAAAEPAPRARPTSLDLSDLPSAESHAAQVVRESMAAHDLDGALEAWRGWGASAAPGLSVSELSWVGRAAASQGDLKVAEEAFSAAAQSTGPDAELGSARVMLARLLEEKLARPEDARAWMERVTREHRGTEAARFASEWLAKRGP